MSEQEKEIEKYKEQELKKKKKHQLAPEPEKYRVDQGKMIGSPDMMTADEKKKFAISAMSRKFGVVGVLAIIIGPLGTLLSLGAAEVVYSDYMLGAEFNKMISSFYRPFIYTATGVFFGVVILAWLVHHFVFSDKKRLIIRADDAIVDAGMEPVEIPHNEGDKDKLIDSFYHLKTPFGITYVFIVIAIVVLVISSVVVFRASAKQKSVTDSARAEVAERIDKSLEGFDHEDDDKVMSFVDRHTFTIDDHITMIIDIDVNGKVLDASYLLRYEAKYTPEELDELGSEGVRKELEKVHATTKSYSDLFVYPSVTEVPVQFSDYMLNYIDNIREKSEWEGDQEATVGSDDYIMHCKVKYSEGKDKASQDDDRMTINYEIQLKNFERTQW